MNFEKASNAQLNHIINFSEVATLADKAAAKHEQFKRSRKRSGKVSKSKRKEIRFR